MVFFRGAEKRLKAAKALKEKGDTPEELLQSIKENEAAVAEAQRVVDAWKAIAGERKRRAEEAERVVQEKAEEEARVEAEKKAEAERKAEEEQRAAEEKRIAEEKAEAERKAQEERERAEEEERDRIEAELDAQKADEEARLEAERKAEEEAVEKDAELKEDKKKPQIKDVVKTIYEKGKAVASKLFGRSFFDVAKTPDFMKKLGLTGDRFTIKYGVLSRHAGKDASHLLTEKQWEELPDAIQKPFAITRFGEKENGYRLYTTMKNDKGETIVVGVDVKNIGRNLEVNSISTIFGRRGDAKITQKEEVLYTDEKITPEQRSLLGQPNSDQYTDTRERNVSADKGSEKPEKKQEKQSVFDKAKEIADKEEKKRKAEADKPKQKPLTEAERKDAEEVAGALGYRVEWVDTMEENGTIDADKKVIRIAKDAENPLVQVLGHEVAHGVKRMDGGKFKALQKAAMEVVGEKEWNERIEKKRKLNAYAEGKLAEEVTCDIVGEALNDKDALKRLAESLRGEKGILARLRDAVAKMVEYFKNRGDKEGVRRMKAADKLLAEFESALKEDVASGQANTEGVDRSVRESGDEPENKRRKDFAERFGVDESYVSDYANGMAQKNTGKAARARRSMERQIYLAYDGKTSKLSDIAKSLKSFKAALKEAFGDLDALIDEYRNLFEEERNMMEAARKKAEEEAAARKRHLDELSLLTDGQIDSRYAEALEKGDETEAREMLDEVARRKGYGDENNEYRMQHRAPSNPGYESDEARRNDIENGPDVNLEDIALGYNRQPDDYFTNPRGYGNDTPHGRESTDAVANALSSIRQGGRDVTVKVYRAVPTTMKEGKLRNGDWVTLSRRYAEMHGNHALNGKYRIMEDEVPAKDIWWDGNDVNEFGYDNGEDYKYKNVKNNRKSDDLVTRDDKGNVIPPSKRFNQRKADERYSRRESKALTAAERELRDNLVERMRKGGLDVVTDSEEMQRVIDTENERTRNMFVGEKGATEADKAEEVSTRLDNLSVARRMEKAKKDAKTIKMATGWERGSDGKWRYETGDAKIKDTIELDGKTFKRYEEDMLWTSGKFGDVVDAPELFKAYPELRDVRIETDAVLNDMPSNGEYNPRTNTITIHSDDLKYQNSILNHEIQHAIQHIEGFETGGSAENVRERIQQVIDNSSDEVGYARERLREWADLNAMAAMLDVAYRKFVGSGNEWERAKAVEIYWDAINTIEDNDKAELAINYPHDKTPREVAESGYLVDDVIRELNRLADETRKEIPDGDIDTMRKVDRLVGALKDKTDFELYNRLAGEVEARNTEKRIGMTEEERKASLASETEDVAREDQILLGVDNADGEMNTGSVREHRVYHGSGADFDAFDHSHMGEGEGAQAYGWGTYVTEVEGIGRTYAIQNTTTHNDALRALQHDVDAISDQLDRHRDDLKYDEEQLKRANEWRAEAELDYELFRDEAEKLKEKYGEASPEYRNHLFNDIYTDEMKRAQSSVKSMEESIQYRKEKIAELEKALKDKQAEIDELPKEFPRHLYTVEIPDDNGSNYLDWNGHPAESLLKGVGLFLESEGFERVQDSPARYEKGESTVVLNPKATGADLYAELQKALGSDKKASQALAELGCIGIKYPADNMRGGRKDGAKNYVIFNENDAKITDHTRFLRTADGEVYGLVKDGRIYLDPKVATAETEVHEYTHLWGDMLRRKDSEQWSHTVKELKNSVLWEEVKELYPELKTDDEIADEVLSTFSGRRGAERLREEARRVADGDGGVFTKAKAIETLERVKEAIARFWEGVAKMFGINRYRSAEELADMAMKDLLDSKNPMKDESGMRKRGEVGETLATSGTYFSGGGLLEAGLKGVIDPKVAVEFSEKIAGVYADNHGNHIVVADVRDVDPKKLVGAVDGGEVQYFHASPVCKNFSKAKREGGEVELDKETALSTAEFIAKTRPKVVTIENVKGYRNSEALKIITDELTRQGYDWDADVYNAADYGGYTKRERLIVRAKRDGKLPPKPEKLPEELRKKGWYSAVEDLIPHLEEKKTGVPQGTDERLKNSGIDYRTIDKPLYVFGRGYANKTVGHAFADELLPTLTTGGGDIIIMPDGRVLKASPRVLARVTGLPDTYKMPETDQLSHTIVGNGIPTQLTEGVIAPLLDNAIPSAERATKRESVFDVADRVSQNLAERQEVNGEDVIRYQSSSENSDKTLAGVHNITEEKLRKALKLGGLANPSVAVIDISKNSHEGFGEISLILPSEKVAKRTGKNAGTWQGDAWTPTYPQIERRMSNKGAEKASKDVLSVPSDMYSEVRIGLDRWLDSGEANSAMAYMFLHEKGVAPEPKKIQPKFSDEAYNELKSITAGNFNIYGISKADAQKVLAMYIDAYFDGDKDLYEDKTKAWLEKNRSIVDAGDKGGMRYAIAKENVKLYDEYGFNYRGVQTFVRDVEYDHRNTGVDMNATLNEVEDYIKTNSLTDEFNTWQEGKEKEYGIKEVIFDGFTPSGNRRYIPNTLENVSKIMKKQGRNGATGAWASFPNFAARLMPSYGTLEDIRSKKGLLTSDREKIDDFREKWSKVFFELGMKCQPDATGTFDDYGFDRLSEAAMTSDPQAFLKQEYNVDFSDEDTKRLKKMVKAIKEKYPAMYFETKFERPVYLNEFAAVVVPNDLGADVKKALSDLGIAMYEYDASKEGDRSRAFDEAVKSSGKIRFQFIGEKGAAEADHAEEVFANENVERSVRENPKSEEPRYSRKPGESIFDYASRVSEDVDRSVREIVSARDEYEKKVKSKGFQTKEALQNSMLGLQEFMYAIDHASGNKRYIEDIPDFENPILGENRLSSVNKEEMHQVAKTQFKPLMSAVAKLSGNGKESGELYDYMFAKHGLERDAVMRQREAQKEFDKYQKANPKGTKTIGDFVASLEGKDYAGLTALTAEDGRVKSIQSQIDAIDEQMEATDNQLLLHYLGGQKKRLKVDLLNAARDAADDIRKAFENNPSHDRSDINELWSRVNEVNGNTLRKLYESGMLTKEAYNDISSMYTNYIPMRGFDQTTSADAYAYLTHGDSAFNAPIKTAKGRSSKADNPIAYMQAMAESAIMQGNRNVLVKQKMLNFVRNHPSDLASVSDVWLQYDSVADEWKPVFPDNIGTNDSASVVAKKMEAFEDKMKQMAEKHPDLVQRSNEAPDIPYKVVEKGQLNEHQVLVKQNGKSYIITVNGSPRAAQAANGLTNPDTDLTGAVGKVFEGAEALNRQLSSLYTTLNPDFIGSNYVRDALYSNTMVYVKEGAKYGGSFNFNFAKYNPAEMANLYARYNKGSLDTSNETHRLFLEFMQNGGETGFVNLKQIEKRKSEIAKAIKRDGEISAAQIWGGLNDAIDFANRAVENSARFAAYVTSRKSGRSVGRSVYDAKEISVNFNRKGSGRELVERQRRNFSFL